MKTFEEYLEYSTTIHGHICAGQVIGVRMSLLGMKHIGIEEPRGKDRKKIYVIVEIDRCATDAIQSVTGTSLGKRTMKWLDYGIMAASFVNLETGKAVRITAREESRKLSEKYHPVADDKYAQQLEAYKIMPEHELFKIENIKIEIPEHDLPGKPLRRVQCALCSDWIQDFRDIEIDAKIQCLNCAKGRYYQVVQ